jgi:diguanylate cyclase (GGDEF)-like protein
MIDIDHFKNVNDTWGHQAGDTVLYNIAQTIVNTVSPAGIACRYGGEEIIVFFPGMTTKDILETAEEVRTAVEKQKIQFGKKKISVTVSCGVSCREENSQEVVEVISAADKALYKAKEEGRNQVRSGKPAMRQVKKK